MKVGEFTMASKRRINCKFCDAYFYDPDEMVAHIEKEHADQIPSDMTPWRFFYYLKTGNATGSCIMCKKPTPWNEKTHKYSRYCGNPKCKEKYVKIFQSRMIGTYGKTHLLNDPEQQKLMLSKRKISGEYIWSTNPNYKFSYTGSYERNFLEFLDKVLFFNPEDIIAPSPHTYYYEYNGKRHFYIDMNYTQKEKFYYEFHHQEDICSDKCLKKIFDEFIEYNSYNKWIGIEKK